MADDRSPMPVSLCPLPFALCRLPLFVSLLRFGLWHLSSAIGHCPRVRQGGSSVEKGSDRLPLGEAVGAAGQIADLGRVVESKAPEEGRGEVGRSHAIEF